MCPKIDADSYTYNFIGNPKKGIGVRYIQALLMFFSLTIGYGMRVTMSVAVVAMTDTTKSNDSSIATFDWNKKTQDIILSSFYWGYTCMQIPGGQIAHKFGAKLLLVYALAINGAVAMVIPHAAQWAGWKAICVCRTIQGLAQGSIIPSLHTLQGKWAPQNERGRMSTIVYGGSQFGTVIVMTLSGFLAATSYGWPLIFYSVGFFNLVWAFVWYWFGAESPAKHKNISLEEKRYIQQALGQTDKKNTMSAPWKLIFTSRPVWAIAITHIGSAWLHITLFTEIPSYLNKVMGVNIKSNGLLSALPFIGMWLTGFFFSTITDYIINKQIWSLTTTRKVANTISTWGTGLLFIALSFVPKNNITVAITLLVIAACLKSSYLVGYHINHIDISPNFAGTLISLSNTLANGCSIMAPITAGLILKNERDPAQWRIVFFILAGIAFFSNLFYLIFASAEKVAWNEPEYFDNEMKEINLKNSPKESEKKQNEN